MASSGWAHSGAEGRRIRCTWPMIFKRALAICKASRSVRLGGCRCGSGGCLGRGRRGTGRRSARPRLEKALQLLSVVRRETEEVRERGTRPEFQGLTQGSDGDQSVVCKGFDVLVRLGSDHPNEVALFERLMIRDERGGLEEVLRELGGNEGVRLLPVRGADLHRPLLPDAHDLNRALALLVRPRQRRQIGPYGVGGQPRRLRDLLDR